ncbi:MAG: crosslink repair DNA glycosylase YcaQ family protein, partial [Candidatus Eisenbacteria bacterium]
SLLWHRERVLKLFGFDYRIEVYVPAAKRKYGYYVLPLLHDGHFIGRADVKTHRVDGVLEIRAIYFEAWFAAGGPPPAAGWGAVDRVRALAGTAAAMRSLATFVGVGKVKLGTVMPRALRIPLRQALAAAKPQLPPGFVGAAEDKEDMVRAFARPGSTTDRHISLTASRRARTP